LDVGSNPAWRDLLFNILEVIGLEPITLCLQSTHSAN
jgi:hypothetical protein